MTQKILISLITCLYCISSFAQDSQELPDIEIKYHADKFQVFDKSRAWLGSRLDRTANTIDLFFNERFFGDEVITGNLVADNKAKLFFEKGYLDSNNEFVDDIGLDVSLSLPNTQEKLKLIVTSNDVNNDRVNNQTLENLESQERNNDFFTGLKFVADKTKRYLPSLEIGARLGSTTETFVEAEWKKSLQYTKSKIDLSQSVTYFSRQELIATLRLNVNKIINDTFLFRFFNQIRYFDLLEQTQFSHVPSLTQKLSSRNAMTYQLSVSGIDDSVPTLDTYTISTAFRRRIHDTWLFFEVEPLYTYRRNQPDNSGAGIFFRLEVLLNE